MGIFSNRLTSLKEESETIFEIEFSDNKLILRSGNDMIWNSILESFEGGYPDFKFKYKNNAPRRVNIMPIIQDTKKAKHGARVKIKHPSSSKTLGTRTIVFDRDSIGNIIGVSVSQYKNQDKRTGLLADDPDIKQDYIDAAYSLIASNPNLINDFISGEATKSDIDDYINNIYNNLPNEEKRYYAKRINIV